MKELDALIEALNEKHVIENLKLTASIVPMPKNCENKQELLNKAVRKALVMEFKKNDNLLELFGDYSYELGLETLVKEIDIKVPEHSNEKGAEAVRKILDELFEILK